MKCCVKRMFSMGSQILFRECILKFDEIYVENIPMQLLKSFATGALRWAENPIIGWCNNACLGPNLNPSSIPSQKIIMKLRLQSYLPCGSLISKTFNPGTKSWRSPLITKSDSSMGQIRCWTSFLNCTSVAWKDIQLVHISNQNKVS